MCVFGSAPSSSKSYQWLVIALMICMLAAGASAEAPFSFNSTPGKLPKNIVPRHYTVRLEPDLATMTTKGSVVIDIEVLQPAKEIVFNALEMEVTHAALLAPHAAELTPTVDSAEQIVRLPLPSELAPGNYKLAIEFKGRIGATAQGLYYAWYPTSEGKKVMLGTQMEPTDARRMVPCWDEPVFRAVFELTVVVPEKHMAISNTPVEREKPLPGGLKEVKFGPTPPMASYLFVFVSGELEELAGGQDGVRIRIITTKGKRPQARYALDATRKLLAYYNRYFGIKFPLPKLDMIAIPGGFTGAMENWGAITFNERALLYDPAKSSLETKQRVFGIIAHEMAHQWFGDLVTTAWWDNLWLNEGFASWMGTKATDYFNPDWHEWVFAGSEKSDVMADDSRSATHPIQQTISNESQANDAFDQITYRKGKAFLRMLESYLGAETFRAGLHDYLNAHRYSNTTTADLWEALEASSGKPVKAISAAWTEQPGLPLIHAKTSCVNNQQVLSLSQERFNVRNPNAEPLRWQVPIAWMNISKPREIKYTLLDAGSNTVPLQDCRAIIKINAGDPGYFRTAYDPEEFEKLAVHINELPIADRLNLLNDSWAMVEAGRASVTDYFALVESLRSEKTLEIWGQVIAVLLDMDGLERGRPGRDAFREYASTLLKPELARLGWSPARGEATTDSLLRNRLISCLGAFGDPDVIAECRHRFESFLVKPESLPAALRVPVLTTVGRYGDEATWSKFHELARKATGTEERQLYYRAMTASTNEAIIPKTLAISLTDETVPQETTRLVTEVAHASGHPEMAWDFAREHLSQIVTKLEAFRLNTYLPAICSAFSDASRADELEEFVGKHLPPDARTKTHEAAEAIRLNAEIKERELPRLDAWVAGRPSRLRKTD